MKTLSYNTACVAALAITFLIEVDALSTQFSDQVYRWLETSAVPFQDAKLPPEILSRFPNPPEIVKLGTEDFKVALHLIPTPKSVDESLPPKLKKDLTDLISTTGLTDFPPKVIHLHEDVWLNKNDIVRSRLLAQLGRSRRIFARKTTSKRINATIAMDFLEEHHLWGATRAKYYYGLFVEGSEDQGEELVAVATFSSRRKILRNDRPHRSHELLRFCAKRNSNVVGGISKLIKIFTLEQTPDDIVTVIDRDWGDGSGWHSVGFETVCTLDPIVMVVNPNEPGLRRQLVGAGISSDNPNKGRMGLPMDILEKLNSLESADETLQALSDHNYFPVYDTGVERLMKLVNNDGADDESAIDLWQNSKPTYAADYYSDNSGISVLLRHAAASAPPPPNLIKEYQEERYMESWRATSGTAKTSATLVFSAQSSMDPDATVEVRERSEGWRTVGIVGGVVKSIYHAVYKVDEQGQVEPTAVISENMKTMVAAMLVALKIRSFNSNPLRVLHLGLGAGTLIRLLAHEVPTCQQVAVEIDSGVVAAAQLLPQLPNLHILTADALTYQRDESAEPFDCVFIDIFDENNLLPPDFYSIPFLTHLRDNVLGTGGIILNNLHSGGKKRDRAIEQAYATYSEVFSSCQLFDTLDSKPNAGNAVLLACDFEVTSRMGSFQTLEEIAERSQTKWGLSFDAPSRLRQVRQMSQLASTSDALA